MPVISRASKTILDLTDGGNLTAYLTANQPTTQIMDTNLITYTPNWVTSNLVITPSAFIDQQAIALSSSKLSIVWKRKEGNGSETDLTTGETVTASGNNKYTLTVSANKLADISSGLLTYVAHVTYVLYEDGTPAHTKTATATASITFTLVKSGDGKSITIVGDQVFKVSATGTVTPSSITLTAITQNVAPGGWQYYDSASGQWATYPGSTSGSTTLTVLPTHTVFTDNIATIRIYAASPNTSIYDIFSVYKVQDGLVGQNAQTVFLTNENITFAGDKDGKVDAVTKTCNVVAYNGTTKTTPTVGTPTGAPTGMTVTVGSASNNEIPITITVSANATLGGAGEQSGTISIPVTAPVSTTLQIRWSKVNTGATGAQGPTGPDGASGQDAYALMLYTPDGNIFTNGVANNKTSLDVYAQFYKGASDISTAGTSYYLWEKYNGTSWTTVQAEATGSSGYKYTVNASAVTGAAIYRCRAKDGSSGTAYYSIVTIIDKTDNYQAEIGSTGGDVFQNNTGESVLYCRIWQNGAEVDPLKSTVFAPASEAPSTGSYYYQLVARLSGGYEHNTKLMKKISGTWTEVSEHTLTYNWYRLDIDGEPMDSGAVFATGKVIHVDSDDVLGKTTFICQVTDGAQTPTLLAQTQFTIRDTSDMIIGNTAPVNPATNQIWLDTSVTPNIMKRWDGSTWITIVDSGDIYSAISQSEEDVKTYVDTKVSEMTLTDSEFTTIFNRTVATNIFGNVQEADRKSIDQVQGDLDNYKTDISVYMRFDDTGTLTLGNSNSSFSTQITNSKMSFLESNMEVAYISNNNMFITNARVTDTLSIGTEIHGYFDWTVTATGLGLKWRNTVEEYYPTLNDFPATGTYGKIYIAEDTGKRYRWDGSGYSEII